MKLVIILNDFDDSLFIHIAGELCPDFIFYSFSCLKHGIFLQRFHIKYSLHQKDE